MKLTLKIAKEILDRRDRSFMDCDLETYLDVWDDMCVVEIPGATLNGKEELGSMIGAAWDAMEPMHMETRSFGISTSLIHQEFAIVWRNRKTDERTLQTGMSVCECGTDYRWLWLHDYFDAMGRESAMKSPKVAQALTRTD
jgi:hypothetical protein